MANRPAHSGRASTLLLCSGLLSAAMLMPAPSLAAEVDAGAIRAVTGADQWSLVFEDADGAPILSEQPRTGLGSDGTLGFRVTGVWRHATEVISERVEADALVAELATTDPLRTIAVRIEPSAEGVISLEARVLGLQTGVDAIGIGFEAPEAERYLGFGERSNAVNQRGNAVENYVSDGPYQAEEYPFLSAFVPPWGLREREDASYFPIPWLLSSAGYGVLVDNPQTSYFRLGSDASDAWSAEVVRAPEGEPGGEAAAQPERLSMRFFAGPKPADALGRFTRDIGRQPMPEAPWVYGAWYQAGDEAVELDAQRAADVPVSVLQTYLHYLPCGDHVGSEAAQPGRTAAAHGRGVAITTYFNPMVCVNYPGAYDPAAAAGALTRNGLGSPALYRYGASPEDTNLVGQYDFFTEAGREQYALRLQEAIDHGYDGWMEDFGEYTPLDSVSGDDLDGTRAHNPYATRYHCAASEAVAGQARPIVRFQRSGWTGATPCAQIVWGGDPTTGWGFDGLASSVSQALNMGLSGVSVWGSDIGGFFALGRNALSDELLMRWVQFGALSGVMRTQRNGVALPPRSRPQVGDPGQIENWRRYAKLHTQLYPYLVAAQARYRETGVPLMRHMALSYPGEEYLVARDDQYMFGPDLLVAPVVEPDARERELALPPGRWVDLWRSLAYDPVGGGLDLGSPTIVDGDGDGDGDGDATLPAPLTEIPLLARAGAILPLLPPDVDTLAGYDSPGAVALADREDQLELIAFPRGASASPFYEDERLVSNEGSGSWTLRVEGSRERSYSLQASLATLQSPFEPCAVRLDGAPLPVEAWSYDPATEALTVSFATAAGTLEATSDCASGAGPGGGRPTGGQGGGGGSPAPVAGDGRCSNEIRGTRGRDRLLGAEGGDRLLGFRGRDTLNGRGGDDCLLGARGHDLLKGGPGDDRLHGSAKRDVLIGGPGRDRLRGGLQSDKLRARDGERDRLGCGPGRDLAIVDHMDEVAKSCEVVRRASTRR